MTHNIKNTENGYIIDQCYALYPIQNAFNKKTSYWLSKDGYTLAVYCFSTGSGGLPVEEQLKNIDSYLTYFENKVNPESNDPEIIGRLVDCVDDWMEENGQEDSIVGENYDRLSSKFRIALGIEKK